MRRLTFWTLFIVLVGGCTSVTPAATPTTEPTPSPTASPTASASPSPTPTATPSPTATAASNPSISPTAVPPGSAFEQLLAHVPTAMQGECGEVVSFDTGSVVGVQCINIPNIDGYVAYYQFDTVANMTAAYLSDVDFFGPDADGVTCSSEPSELGYNIGGVPTGRVMCADYEDGQIMYWTYDDLVILSTIVHYGGNYSDLTAIWQIAGPDPVSGSPIPDSTSGPTSWSSGARDYRGQVGRQVVFNCPAGGSPSRIWGTDEYTDDSSVCSAAVHVGLIALATGGQVTIEMTAGRNEYPATDRNGISSAAWGTWDSSFIFVSP